MAGSDMCAHCGGPLGERTPEEDMLAELHETFGKDMTPEDCAIVCDECWEKMRPDKKENKKIFEDWKKKGGR